MKKNIFPICCLAIAAVFSSCTKEEVIEQIVVAPSETTLLIDSRVGNEDFALNTDFTIEGTTYRFETLRYWLSNVVFVSENGTEYEVPESYYLMEEVGDLRLSTINDGVLYPGKKREEVTLEKIPVGSYKSVRFSIGVDSKYNNNLSLQAGELSIANGMSNVSWMWHTSYIFSSLAGKATRNTVSAQTFVAETGLNDNYKTITVDLPSPLKVEAAKISKLSLYLDLAKVLENVDVITHPTIGANKPDVMKQIANNFSESAFGFTSAE